jgi:hypothetical protein
MATDDFSSGGMNLFGYIIAFVIIVWVISAITGGAGFGFGGCNRGWNTPCGDYQTLKEIFEGQKANISQTATTQFLIEQQSAANRELIAAQTNAINTKIDFYGYQNERDKNAELSRQIMELKNQLFVKDQLAPITATLSNIQCNMLRRPDVTGIGVACPSAAILNGLGVNSLNNCNNCSHGTVI